MMVMIIVGECRTREVWTHVYGGVGHVTSHSYVYRPLVLSFYTLIYYQLYYSIYVP